MNEFAEHVRERIVAGEPQFKLAEELNVCKQTITNINQGVAYAKNS